MEAGEVIMEVIKVEEALDEEEEVDITTITIEVEVDTITTEEETTMTTMREGEEDMVMVSMAPLLASSQGHLL